MVRTQVCLTEEERAGLAALAHAAGRKQSELIRAAVDQYLAAGQEQHRAAVLRAAAGLWRDRDDLPDFAQVRREWDRGQVTVEQQPQQVGRGRRWAAKPVPAVCHPDHLRHLLIDRP
jgi:hypothetical protein